MLYFTYVSYRDTVEYKGWFTLLAALYIISFAEEIRLKHTLCFEKVAEWKINNVLNLRTASR